MEKYKNEDNNNNIIDEELELTNREKIYKIHLLEDVVRDLYLRWLHEKLTNFSYWTLEVIYAHVKTCIKQTALEVLERKLNFEDLIGL